MRDGDGEALGCADAAGDALDEVGERLWVRGGEGDEAAGAGVGLGVEGGVGGGGDGGRVGGVQHGAGVGEGGGGEGW